LNFARREQRSVEGAGVAEQHAAKGQD